MVLERSELGDGDVLIHGGRIIDPSQGVDAVGDLLISGGRVACLDIRERAALPENCNVLRAYGMVVCPGFVDLHCHLRQPGFEEKETIATGTRAAAKGGFTTVCCMPNTEPPVDTGRIVDYIRSVAAREGIIRVLPVACVSKRRAGIELADFGELSKSGAVAFSDDGRPVADLTLMRRALEGSRDLDLPVFDHCEDLAMSGGGAMREGEVARGLGLKGIPAAAESSVVARDIKLAKAVGGRLHICHVSTAESVELIRRAKAEGILVTTEVTPHHLTLTEGVIDVSNTGAKVNPPLGTAEDIEALIGGLKDGVIDAIATDHAPHTAEDKDRSFEQAAFGISGFETALGSLMGLVHQGKLDLVTLISKLTREPAAVLQRADLGTLKPGSLADITVFDPEADWVVNPDEFVSKGRNTPLAGRVLKGRVMLTIYSGDVSYKEDA